MFFICYSCALANISTSFRFLFCRISYFLFFFVLRLQNVTFTDDGWIANKLDFPWHESLFFMLFYNFEYMCKIYPTSSPPSTEHHTHFFLSYENTRNLRHITRSEHTHIYDVKLEQIEVYFNYCVPSNLHSPFKCACVLYTQRQQSLSKYVREYWIHISFFFYALETRKI